MVQMLHLGDSEDEEMEFNDVPLTTVASSAAAAPSRSGTRPRHVSSEAADAEGEEEEEESKPRTHQVSRFHSSQLIHITRKVARW